MGSNRKENRRHPRVRETADARVHIQSAPGFPDLEGKEFACKAGDISLGGVRLNLDRPVPPRSLVELEIALADPPSKYRFTGTTVWAQEHSPAASGRSGPTHRVGVELDTSDNPMAASWKRAVEKIGHRG